MATLICCYHKPAYIPIQVFPCLVLCFAYVRCETFAEPYLFLMTPSPPVVLICGIPLLWLVYTLKGDDTFVQLHILVHGLGGIPVLQLGVFLIGL